MPRIRDTFLRQFSFFYLFHWFIFICLFCKWSIMIYIYFKYFMSLKVDNGEFYFKYLILLLLDENSFFFFFIFTWWIWKHFQTYHIGYHWYPCKYKNRHIALITGILSCITPIWLDKHLKSLKYSCQIMTLRLKKWHYWALQTNGKIQDILEKKPTVTPDMLLYLLLEWNPSNLD